MSQALEQVEKDINEFDQMIERFNAEKEKAVKGNKSAQAKLRKVSLELKVWGVNFRKHSMAFCNEK